MRGSHVLATSGLDVYSGRMSSGSREEDPASIAARFNNRINEPDVEGLERLMTDDHIFVDSKGGRVEGKQPGP